MVSPVPISNNGCLVLGDATVAALEALRCQGQNARDGVQDSTSCVTLSQCLLLLNLSHSLYESASGLSMTVVDVMDAPRMAA
jgi:hypothetical protein